MDSETDDRLNNTEVEYYKSQVNVLAGAIISLEYKIAEMSNEVEQMKKGLELIADLHGFDSTSSLAEISDHFTEQINIKLKMDRSLILMPVPNNPESFSPFYCKGYSPKDIDCLEKEQILIPPSFQENKKSLLFNSQAEHSVLTDLLADKLRVKYFVLTPVVVQKNIIFFLFAGRKVETVLLAASRLLLHDVHTMEAIAGVIAAIWNQFEKFKLLNDERTRIAREMHDDIGAELTKVKMFSHALAASEPEGTEKKIKLRKISEAASRILESVNEIVWTMNNKNDDVTNLAAYIRRYASEYLESHGIDYIIDFPEDLPPFFVGNIYRRNILLVVKEALHNIVKHANSTKVIMKWRATSGILAVTISDDGKGMKQDTTRGTGLHSMKARIEQVGGAFSIESELNKGTNLSFAIKLP